jgi:hypothetical protein
MYEDKAGATGLQVIKLDYMCKDSYFLVQDEIPLPGVSNISIFSYNDEEALLLSGNIPKIYKDGQIVEFFGKTDYTYIIKETNEKDAFLIFIKELYMILLVKAVTDENKVKQKYVLDNLDDRNLNDTQVKHLYHLIANMNNNLIIVNVFGLNTSPEILHVHMDYNKTLILINSTDRILRLYKYDFDTVTLVKDFFDSVNRKRWINSYFYKFNIRNSYQDLIVSAFTDSNSLEFVFIDINTGNYIKRLDPIKFPCFDFICHYNNHYSIVIISNRKLFLTYGYLVNHWGSFAPQFKYIEENIEYIEEETFFDTFNQMLKKSNIPKKTDKDKVRAIFYPQEKQKDKTFFKYLPSDDSLAIQSEKDLKEIFHQMNEILEIKK